MTDGALLERRLLVLVAAVAATAVCAPMLVEPDAMSTIDDWLTFYSLHAMVRGSLLSHGELPRWSPWAGGGYPIVGHPELPNLTPFVLPTLAFGEVVGLKVCVWLYCLIGALGMAALAHGTLRLRLPGSLIAVGAFTFSGWLPGRVLSGNLTELAALWFPFLVVLLERARTKRDVRAVLAMSGILAITTVDGKWVPAVLGLMLGLWAVLNAFTERGLRHRLWPLGIVVAVGLLALPLAAAKLLPFLDLLRRTQSLVPDNPARYADVTSLHPGRLFSELTIGWPKVKYLVGFVPLALALVAAMRRLRWSARWVALGGVSVWLMVGAYAPLDLFHLLWRVPPFGLLSSAHIPFGPFLITALCVLAGRGTDELMGMGNGEWGMRNDGKVLRVFRSRFGLVFLLVAIVVPLEVLTAPAVYRVFTRRPLFTGPARLTPAFYQVRTLDLPRRGEDDQSPFKPRPEVRRPLQADLYYLMADGAGLIDWRGTLLLPAHAVPKLLIDQRGRTTPNPAYSGAEVRCLRAGSAVLKSLAPNRIQVDVTTAGPDTLVVNQNFDPGWRTTVGSVRAHEGLLAVDLAAAGRTTVDLTFHSQAFSLGLLISSATWTGMAVLALGLTWRRRRRFSSCGGGREC